MIIKGVPRVIDKTIDRWLGRRKRDLYVIATKGLVLQGYSTSEVSTIMGVSEYTVRMYLQADRTGYPPMKRGDLIDFLEERGVRCT